MSEPKIFRIKLRSFSIDVVAVEINDALNTWQREVSNHEAIDYNDEQPDSIITCSQWVAISDKASRAYKADIKERSR